MSTKLSIEVFLCVESDYTLWNIFFKSDDTLTRLLRHTKITFASSSVASPNIQSRYANFFVFIDCENNQFLKK